MAQSVNGDLRGVVNRVTKEIEERSRTMVPWVTDLGLDLMMSSDIVDRGDSLEVTVEVPGFESEEVSVYATESSLTVVAERDEETEEEDERYLRRERSRRSARRRIDLPEEIDIGDVEAKLENGILVVSCGKKVEEDNRKINID